MERDLAGSSFDQYGDAADGEASLLLRKLFTLGECTQYCSRIVTRRLFLMVQTMISGGICDADFSNSMQYFIPNH